MKKAFILFLLLFVFALPGRGSAHLDAGEDRSVGEYLIDFGYSPEQIIAGKSANIAFNLVDPETEQVIAPAAVWVRISSRENIVFAGTFAPETGHVVFTYTFPEAGNYEVKVRFKDEEEKVLAETDFELPVDFSAPSEERRSLWQKIWSFLKFW